jgi:hypothetical protein
LSGRAHGKFRYLVVAGLVRAIHVFLAEAPLGR